MSASYIHKTTATWRGRDQQYEWEATLSWKNPFHTATKQLCCLQLHRKEDEVDGPMALQRPPTRWREWKQLCDDSSQNCLLCTVPRRVTCRVLHRGQTACQPCPLRLCGFNVVYPCCHGEVVCLEWFAELQNRWEVNQVKIKKCEIQNARD